MSDAFRHAQYKKVTKIATTNVWQLKGAPDQEVCFFESSLAVDADGAPNAYAPHGVPGTLDYLANAGHPGGWYGIVTDKHKNPIVQSGKTPEQPCAGFYISPTSLHDILFPESDVRRFADATRIPYIALPPVHVRKMGFKLGDFALVINATNGKFTYVVFADAKSDKPTKVKLGEFSIATCAAIDAPTDARHGSMPKGVITVLFPSTGIGQGSIPSPELIQNIGRSSLRHFSNFRDKGDALPKAFPEYPTFAKALSAAGY